MMRTLGRGPPLAGGDSHGDKTSYMLINNTPLNTQRTSLPSSLLCLAFPFHTADTTLKASLPAASTTLYLTPIVHSLSLSKLEMVPHALVAVSAGRVAWVEHLKDRQDPAEAAEKHGIDYEAADKVVVSEGFMCPGFVDTHTVSLNVCSFGWGEAVRHRYGHTAHIRSRDDIVNILLLVLLTAIGSTPPSTPTTASAAPSSSWTGWWSSRSPWSKSMTMPRTLPKCTRRS